MALIGSILKKAIEIGNSLMNKEEFHKEQINVLHHLLKKAVNTKFGEYYRFDEILLSENIEEAFAYKVPFFDYHRMQKEWWYRFKQKEEDISWPGTPNSFALSSGTTGKKSKRIPVSDEMLEAIRMAGIKQIGATANFDLPPSFFEKEVLMLGSTTRLNRKNGYLEGEISGISANNLPGWFKGFYRPGEEIASIEDWDDKVLEIAKHANEWDIGAISGIPSWLELMMKKIIKYHHVTSIHDIWPNLEVFTSGGIAFEPYKKRFSALMRYPVTVIDTYFASEGFIAFQERPDTTAMKLLIDNGIYFEFVPFEPEYISPDGIPVDDAPVLNLNEVEENVEYVLLISTVSGLWRYMIGDTIKFTNVERVEIKITGRTKFFLNVVGSQLSVQKMHEALRELEHLHQISIPEFTVAAIKIDDEYYHKWYLGTVTYKENSELAQCLDELLKSSNKNYAVARRKALKGILVETIPEACFNAWKAELKHKGGQVKMEQVMDEEQFQKWEKFVRNWNFSRLLKNV